MLNELDLRSLWKELDSYEKELESETKSLQEVWLKIAQLKSRNEADMKMYIIFLLIVFNLPLI
jgi:hypothetical protein